MEFLETCSSAELQRFKRVILSRFNISVDSSKATTSSTLKDVLGPENGPVDQQEDSLQIPESEQLLPLLQVSDLTVDEDSREVSWSVEEREETRYPHDSIAHFTASLALSALKYSGDKQTRNRLAVTINDVVQTIRKTYGAAITPRALGLLELKHFKSLLKHDNVSATVAQGYQKALDSSISQEGTSAQPSTISKDEFLIATRKAQRSHETTDGTEERSVTLVLPSAGRSSRFPGTKPKWMLTQPNGRLMVVDSISQLNPRQIKRVVLGILELHLNSHCKGDIDAVLSAFEDGNDWLQTVDVSVVVLKNETSDQIQTIERIISAANIEGAVFLKDCDNRFACDVIPADTIASLRIERANEDSVYNVASKGYLACGKDGNITSVIEKVMVSNTICVGGYGFLDAKSFMLSVAQARQISADFGRSDSELAVSDVFWLKMLRGERVNTTISTGYEDWGTLPSWRKYCNSFKTLFIDIDGTLVKNSGQYFQPIWGSTEALVDNVKFLTELHQRGRTKIILTTSRTERFREATIAQMQKIGLPYDDLLLGMPHAQRVVINDFAPTNPYPSGLAINLHRNDDNLRSFMVDSLL